MLSELGTAALIGAGVLGGGSAGDTVGVIGIVTLVGGMWSGTVSTALCFFTLFANVAILLAFVATNGLLSILDDNYPGVRNENALSEEVVSYDGGGAKDFDICCLLVGGTTFRLFDPRSRDDGAFFEIVF